MGEKWGSVLLQQDNLPSKVCIHSSDHKSGLLGVVSTCMKHIHVDTISIEENHEEIEENHDC